MQQIGEKSSGLVQEFVFNSVAPGTLKIYRYTWDLLGRMVNCQVSISTNTLLTLYLSANFFFIVFKVPPLYPLFYPQDLQFPSRGRFILLWIVLLRAIMFHFFVRYFQEIQTNS